MKDKLKRIELLQRLLDSIDPEPVSITVTIHPGKNALHTDELKYKIENDEFAEIKKALNIKKITLLERTDEDE